MRYDNCIILSAADTQSQNGNAIDSSYLINASWQAYFGDSTVNGTVKIQGSNDVLLPGNSPTHWSDIPNATVTITTGGTALIPYTQLSYRYIRAVFTYSSGGSSTVTVTMAAQGI